MPKSDPGYYVLDQNEADRYARGGAAGVDWSPVEEGDGGAIDYSRDGRRFEPTGFYEKEDERSVAK